MNQGIIGRVFLNLIRKVSNWYIFLSFSSNELKLRVRCIWKSHKKYENIEKKNSSSIKKFCSTFHDFLTYLEIKGEYSLSSSEKTNFKRSSLQSISSGTQEIIPFKDR